MSYTFRDEDYPPDTVWIWKLTVETTSGLRSTVQLANGTYLPCLKESYRGVLFVVDRDLGRAEELLGNRLVSAERLGPAFFPAEHPTEYQKEKLQQCRAEGCEELEDPRWAGYCDGHGGRP